VKEQDKHAETEWTCSKCRVPLQKGKVNVAYMQGMFPVDLHKCPDCGQVFIPEDLALGKMAQVEKLLEDK
jgi:hypothetical protein